MAKLQKRGWVSGCGGWDGVGEGVDMAIKAQQESFLAVITTFCIFLYEDQCPAVILCCSFARCFTWENWMKGIQDLFLLFLATACQSIITSKNYFNLKSNKGTHY